MIFLNGLPLLTTVVSPDQDQTPGAGVEHEPVLEMQMPSDAGVLFETVVHRKNWVGHGVVSGVTATKCRPECRLIDEADCEPPGMACEPPEHAESPMLAASTLAVKRRVKRTL